MPARDLVSAPSGHVLTAIALVLAGVATRCGGGVEDTGTLVVGDPAPNAPPDAASPPFPMTDATPPEAGRADVPTEQAGRTDVPPKDAASGRDAAASEASRVPLIEASTPDRSSPPLLPPPPPECMPECVWRIFESCLPGPDCILEPLDGYDAATVTLYSIASVCDPATGLDSQRLEGGSGGTSLDIRRDGEICYQARWGGRAPFAGTDYGWDGVTAIIDPDWTGAACDFFGNEHLVMQPDSPACAPWFDRMILTRACAVGTCPAP